jgi:hypothetical protein
MVQTVLHAILRLRHTKDVRGAFVATHNENLPSPELNDDTTSSIQNAIKAAN